MRTSKPPRRRRIGKGIYQDVSGISATVCVRPFKPLWKRYPLGTDLKTIRAWQLRTRADLEEQRDALPTIEPGTLAADLPRFLETLAESKRADFKMLLEAWIETRRPNAGGVTFGDTLRTTITEPDIRAQLGIWASPPYGPSGLGYAANTLNHRKRALSTVYRNLDGKRAANPCTDIDDLAEPPPQPRGIPLEIVELLLKNLPDRGRPVKGQTKRTGSGRSTVSLSKIRLRVIAWTGLPHAQLKRVEARDVRFDNGTLRRTLRRKSQVIESWVPLIPPAIEAFRDYAAAGLWGQGFSNSALHGVWQRTVTRTFRKAEAEADRTGDRRFLELLRASIPEKCKPYDLRHSFLTDAQATTGDLAAVAELAQHASLTTTQRYTKGAVSVRAAAAIEKMSTRWAPSPDPPQPKPRLRAFRGGKAR